ncbi:amino acid adenylation domain-containing protein [Streptomyces sp. NPDC005811]|uniref:amino acid adenylation domain-containing protein n=1 Tax=Streptomyces sp. NPDC005811 TaxID=3154565 RepID=UPI0033DF3BBA
MTVRRPLPAAQEAVWTGQRLDPDSPAYNTAEYLHLYGPVDTAAFDAALHHVVAETEALNVVYGTDARGRPWESPAPADGWRLHAADLTTAPHPHAAALARMRQDLARPVDLARGPLFGHALLRIAREEYLWYHRVHHIALDGYGLSLVARRVAEVYTALATGAPVGDSGFGTLASVREEERAYRESAAFARDRAYWTGRFADRPPVATPAGRTALPAPTFHRRTADLGAERTEALRAAARELEVTWSEILLAVTAARLHRATGAPEIVLSLPAMGRLGSVSLRVPCMVRNILPLRVPVMDRDSPRDLAGRISRELRAALPHQRYRYERLRRDLRLVGGQRRLSGPGVNIMPFAYDLRFAGHRSTVHNVSAGPVDDLSVNVYDRSEGAGLRLAVDAHPGLYTEADVTAFRDGLLDLLDRAVADPDGALTDRPPTPRAVAAPVPVLDGGPLPGPARPVLDLIAERARREGGAVAVEHGGREVTYAELLREAADVARRLADRGVGAGDLVAVVLPRGIDAITALLGVLLSGAAYCPLDPTAPPARLADLLARARPRLVLTDTGLSPSEPGTAGPAADGLAYVLHTSGSTGRPKGVEIGHRALARFVAGATPRYGLRSADRVLQFAPLHFDTSVEEIFLTLCAGATLVVRTDDMTDSVPGFLAACARLRISFLDLPTAYWHELAYAVSAGAAAFPAGVHTVVIGGEPALPERVDRWRGTVGTAVRLLNTYGPTEATVVATVADLHDPALAPGDVPIGRPLPGTRAAVVDGELHLLGDNLARGYRGDHPDASRFAPLTALPGAPRAYRTGDLARVGDDGQLRHLGRTDTEFKISGHRVHPAEVESALLALPGIRDAAVVGQVLPDGTRRLAAHVVPDGPAPAPALLRERLRAALPAATVPSAITFLDALPRTGTGKTDRRALTETRTEPTEASGALADASGAPARTSGRPADPSATPADRSGMLADPSGTPADRSGMLADPSGTPADRSGMLADPSGTPADRSGMLADPSGPPADPSGPPADPSGTLADPSGRPADSSGASADLFGAPADPSGVLAEASGPPADSSGASADLFGAPADPSGVLAEASGLPARASGPPADPSGTLADPSGRPADPSGAPADLFGAPAAPARTPAEPARTPAEPSRTPADPSRTPADPSRTPAEVLAEVVAGVWREVLGAAAVSPADDVFDLGAQSLQAIQAANRLGAALGREVKVGWLFQHPTPAALADRLERRPPPSAAGALPAALLADTVLDPDIRPGLGPRAAGAPDRILLTGATGFVGVHLLAELVARTDAEIVCTVRAPGPAEAGARLDEALRTHRIRLPERARVTALPADLSRPRLGLDDEQFAGLAETCGAVLHCAAAVSVLREYTTLRAANTGSTRELLRLTAPRSVPLHFVSTLSVAPPLGLAPEVPEAFLAPHAGLRHGYQQSKWAAERLLEQAAERGLPVTVHRLGRVVGPRTTGYVDERDFLWSVLRAGIPAGVVPDLFEEETWTPVDQVARALVHLALRHRGAPAVYHHTAGAPVRLRDLHDWLGEYGYALRRVSLAEWRSLLPPASGVAATTLAFFDSLDASGGGTDLRLGRIRCDHVVAGLRDSGIAFPPVDRALVFRYLDRLVTAGLLPEPTGRNPQLSTFTR